MTTVMIWAGMILATSITFEMFGPATDIEKAAAVTGAAILVVGGIIIQETRR